VAQRKKNNPELCNSYSCTTYNKVVFAALPNRHNFNQKWMTRDSSRKRLQQQGLLLNNLERNAAQRYLLWWRA